MTKIQSEVQNGQVNNNDIWILEIYHKNISCEYTTLLYVFKYLFICIYM